MFAASTRRMNTGRPVAALLSVLVSVSLAPRAEAEDSWRFAVTPYLWLPHIGSSLSFETTGTDGSIVDLSDYWKNLQAALFLNAEARKGAWSLALDFVYCDFGNTTSKVSSVIAPGGVVDVPINSGTSSSLTGSMLSLVGGYSVLQRPDSTLDVLAGLRRTHIGATLNWNFELPVSSLPQRTGSVSRDADLWDGVVGIRGNLRLGGGRWFVPAYLDAGAGTSKFTWQAAIGIGYSFRWGDLRLAYRYLSFEEASDKLIQNLYLQGPALGATFRF